MTARKPTPAPIPDELRWALRVSDIAARCGLSETEIREALRRGDLKGRRYHGRVWMIDPQEARAWLERSCEPAAA